MPISNRIRPRRIFVLLAALAAPAFGATPEPQAEAPRELLQPPKHSIPSPITDRFALKGIYYQPSVSTLLRYDSSTGVPGTEFSAEDTLGLDSELNQGSIEMWLRMGERHRIRVDYFKMTRKGDVVLDQALNFGDTTFLAGERVVSAMDMRTLGITYTYSLWRRETFEIGLGLGIQLVQLEGSAEAPVRFVGEKFDTAGPMATIALDGTWRFTQRFSANARVQYLQGNTGNVDGLYGQYHLDVQFRWRPNMAFGLGYSQTRMKVDSSDPSFAGLFDLEYRGPEAFVRVSF
ncbi:MAG: hypothetical protein ABI616_11535 [Pseudomonadota bacterium]